MKHSVSAPSWSRKKIIDAAQRLGKQYEAIVGRSYIISNGLHFDDVYEKLLYPKFGVELHENVDLGGESAGPPLLGRYEVGTNTAYLSAIISREGQDPRRIFTCRHEVAGHGVLQGQWLRNQLAAGGNISAVDVTEYSLSATDERRLEWQANVFASHLAAPDWLINCAMHRVFHPNRPFPYTGPCQGLQERKHVVDFGDLCGWIGSKISGYFGGLSDEAVGYRLAELGWVTHNRAFLIFTSIERVAHILLRSFLSA